jgi:hypothetical protein
VLLENLRKLARSVFSFRQPLWISDDARPACDHEPRCRAGLRNPQSGPRERNRKTAAPGAPPPTSGHLRLQHVKFARERGRVRRLGKLSGPHRGADEHSRTLCGLTQGLVSDAGAKSQAKGCRRQNKNKHSPFHVVTPSELPPIHFASGRNSCKGHCSHCGCDFRQYVLPTPTISPCISLNTWTSAVRSAALTGEGR